MSCLTTSTSASPLAQKMQPSAPPRSLRSYYSFLAPVLPLSPLTGTTWNSTRTLMASLAGTRASRGQNSSRPRTRTSSRQRQSTCSTSYCGMTTRSGCRPLRPCSTCTSRQCAQNRTSPRQSAQLVPPGCLAPVQLKRSIQRRPNRPPCLGGAADAYWVCITWNNVAGWRRRTEKASRNTNTHHLWPLKARVDMFHVDPNLFTSFEE